MRTFCGTPMRGLNHSGASTTSRGAYWSMMLSATSVTGTRKAILCRVNYQLCLVSGSEQVPSRPLVQFLQQWPPEPVYTGTLQSESWNMEAGSSRRNFIRRSLIGAAIGGLLTSACAASNSDETESRVVDRCRLGRIDADVSILGLGLGGEFIRGYVGNVEAGHALLESALAQGINYWDTARNYGPSEGSVATLELRRSLAIASAKLDRHRAEQTKNEAME
jgi:hypothetical protein